MAGHVQHIVDAPHDGEIAGSGIAHGPITGQIPLTAEFRRVIGAHETFRISPESAQHARPGTLHHQAAALAPGQFLALLIHNSGLNAGQRQGAGAGHQRRGTGQWRNHVGTSFGLPESIQHGTAAVAHSGVVPHPGFRIDRLPHRAKDAQGRQIVVARQLGAELDQRTNRRGRCIKNADLVPLYHLPETPRIRPGGNAFKNHLGCTAGQRAIHDIGMPSHPADVGGTPENIRWLNIKHPLHADHGMQQITR